MARAGVAVNVRVRKNNIPALRRSLQSQNELLGHLMEETGYKVAMDRVPFLTGFLMASIGSEVRSVGHGVTVRVFASAPYASFVEFGTSKQAAQPFITPAQAAMARLVGSSAVIRRYFTPKGIG